MSPEVEENHEHPRITISVQRLAPNTTVIKVVGELTGNAVSAMQRKVTGELTASSAGMILDLSGVALIDAHGIEALASAAAIAGEADISFCLVDPPNSVGAALAAAELADLFEVFPSVDDAIRGPR